jgi:sugar phosphate permease
LERENFQQAIEYAADGVAPAIIKSTVRGTSYKLFSIFAVLSALYVLSQFFRTSNAIIATKLIQDLGLNAETLGILGGAFFYSFALFQIPMGPMLDRIGPRLVISYSVLLGALGAFLFAIAESFTAALVGRILIGLGMAAVLMGSMKVFILHFPANRFATLAGTILSIGTLGNILATSPLAYVSSTIGWRITFFIAAGATAFFAFLSLSVLRGNEGRGETPGPDSSPRHELGVFQSIGLILRSLSFWQIGFLAFFRYGTFVGLQGLWLGPYLIAIKGYAPVQAGNLLILLAVGTIIGGPIAGRLSDQIFHSRKGVAFWGGSLYFASLLPLAGILEIQNPLWYGVIFFFVGFFNSFGLLVFSHVKDLFPAAISGTAMTFVNFFTMAGGAIFMPFLGKVIESFPRTGNSYPSEAYHLSFLICSLGVAASLIFYAFSQKDIRR